jgi:hypothetical protein
MSYVARAIASAVLTLMSGIGLSHIFERVRPVPMMGDLAMQPPMGKMVDEPVIVHINLIPPPDTVAVTGRLVISDWKPKGRRLK